MPAVARSTWEAGTGIVSSLLLMGYATLLLSVLQVLEALAVTKPAVAAAEVRKVQDRFRAKHFCERVLAKAAEAEPSGI